MSPATNAPWSAAALDRLLRPRSVAIVGASATPGSLGAATLGNLVRAGFPGTIHLINPKRAEIDGRPCLAGVDDLPEGVDCAILAIPRAGVLATVQGLARRGVGAAIIFAAGFAEGGPEGRAEQEEVARIARAANMVIEGPNCLGSVNYLDRTPLTFIETEVRPLGGRPGVAVVSQSGAMAAVLSVGLRHHNVDITFSVSTGNEAASTAEDYVEYFIDEPNTRVITMLVEQFRQPRRFLALARRARAKGKHIALLHPGRSSAARASATTHTGAMVGDDAVMRIQVRNAGVALVETLEELIDVSELLVRLPAPPRGGAMVVAESGAFKALTLDFAEEIGLPLPALEGATEAAFRAFLPAFIPPSNPLDMTAQALVQPELYRQTLEPPLQDPAFGSVLFAIILTDLKTSSIKFPPILDAIRSLRPEKPVVFAALDEGATYDRSWVDELHALGVPFLPTPERALRALAQVTRLGAQVVTEPAAPPALDVALPAGTAAEHQGKAVLAALGIPVPAGGMATNLDEARAIARRIGFPVVLKAQAAALSHKSEAGGVVLNLGDEAALEAGWQRLHESVGRHQPDLRLDGVLVEKMGARGTELIIGARNDKDWGPVLLVGFGGVQAEAMRDTRLMPADLPAEAIAAELLKLKAAALLKGFRGAPPLDVAAAADVAARLAGLMRARPEVAEIEINPLVVYGQGQGALALDALIVTR